jgi:N-acetylmuramoyl-L-alanine amidase
MRFLIVILTLLYSSQAFALELTIKPNSVWVEMPNLTPKEIRCMSMNLYHEARGESNLGLGGVMTVVLNRVKSGKWANNVCDVIWQPYQFSWTIGKDRKTFFGCTNTEDYARIVLFILDAIKAGGYNSPTIAADHYKRFDVDASWAKSMNKVRKIDAHEFFISKK